MPLLSLPNELILSINKQLPYCDQYSLLSTNRRLYAVLGGLKGLAIPLSERYNVRLAAEKHLSGLTPDGRQPIRRTCSSCLRLLPFYHFTHRVVGHNAYSLEPWHHRPVFETEGRENRKCIACLEKTTWMHVTQSPPWIFGLSLLPCVCCSNMVVGLRGVAFSHGPQCPCRFCGRVPREGGLFCGCRLAPEESDLRTLWTFAIENKPKMDWVVGKLVEKIDKGLFTAAGDMDLVEFSEGDFEESFVEAVSNLRYWLEMALLEQEPSPDADDEIEVV